MTHNKRTELLIFTALLVSPLIHASTESIELSRTMWSCFIVISIALITFFYSYQFRVQSFFSAISFTTALLTVGLLSMQLYPIRPLALYYILIGSALSYAIFYIYKKGHAQKTAYVVVIIGCIALYSQWGIAQFIVQQDIGLVRIGESTISPNISGVASFYWESKKFIRAYGPFAHANSFGGVILLGITLLFIHRKTIRDPLFNRTILFILSLGLLTSFSRAALLGGAYIFAAWVWKNRSVTLVPIAIAILLFTPLLFFRSVDSHGVAAEDRQTGLIWFMNISSVQSIFRGFGIGNYSYALQEFLTTNAIPHDSWDIAPIHSVPLLLLAELGIGLTSLCLGGLYLFWKRYKPWPLLALAPALILDHYFATQLAPTVFLIVSSLSVVQ